MKYSTLVSGLIFITVSANANIVINGTRFIYPEKNKEIVVQLNNSGDAPSLVQAWIDNGDINSTPETAKVPFLLSPPVVKVAKNSGQQLRIQKLAVTLPADRESIFFLNVLDIPPVPENLKDKNTLQLAVKSRLKLFYRPQKLQGGPDYSDKEILLSALGQTLKIANKSPYYFSISNISAQDKKPLLSAPVMVAPFSTLTTASRFPVKGKEKFTLIYVDDFGAYNSKTFTAE